MMKKIVMCMIICSLLLCSCGKKEDSGTEISLKENQSMVIGKITEIAGNDMTVSLLEESSMGSRGGKGGQNGDMPMPTGEDGKPEMPEGQGDMPMPTGEDGRPEMPEGQENSSSDEKKDGNKGERKTFYIETGETASYTVPVGTTVTTALGTKTNFSGLAEGDTIKIVLEKDDSGNDTVVGIWIVE